MSILVTCQAASTAAAAAAAAPQVSPRRVILAGRRDVARDEVALATAASTGTAPQQQVGEKDCQAQQVKLLVPSEGAGCGGV